MMKKQYICPIIRIFFRLRRKRYICPSVYMPRQKVIFRLRRKQYICPSVYMISTPCTRIPACVHTITERICEKVILVVYCVVMTIMKGETADLTQNQFFRNSSAHNIFRGNFFYFANVLADLHSNYQARTRSFGS